jgi:hypothetical protein
LGPDVYNRERIPAAERIHPPLKDIAPMKNMPKS